MKNLSSLIVSAISKSYQLIAGFFLTYFITRNLGVDHFGQYSARVSELFIFSFLVKLGFDVQLLKEHANFRLYRVIIPHYMALFLVGLAVSLLFFPVGFGLRALSVVLFSFTLVFAEFWRRRNKNSSYIFLTGGAQYTIQVLLYLVYMVKGPLSPDLTVFVSVTGPFLVVSYICRRQVVTGLMGIVDLRPSIVAVVLKESAGQVMFNLTTVLNNWLGTYLLSIIGGPAQVGVYSAVKRLANGLSFPMQLFNITFANPLARSLNDREKLEHVLLRQRRLFFYSSIVVALVGLGLYPFVHKIVPVGPNLIWDLRASYLILLSMAVVNMLTGPTFIFTRLTGKLFSKVTVILTITALAYGGAASLNLGPGSLRMSVAAFISLNSINAYLLWRAWIEDRLKLYASA